MVTPVLAETSFPLAAGDTVITGFPGTVLTKEALPAGVNPIDKTVIGPVRCTNR